jgi:predicted transcriptional regulator
MVEAREMILQAEEAAQKATELNVFGRTRISTAMNEIGEALDKINELTSNIAGVQGQLQIIFEQAKTLTNEGFERDDLLQCLADMAKVATTGQAVMERQRDEILQEAATVLERLKNGEFFDQDFELGGEVYEKAVEQHNQAFWESLPYDMATMLGDKWDSRQTDLLYSLLTDEAEDVAEGYNLDVEDVTRFRDELFEMVNKLYEGGE